MLDTRFTRSLIAIGAAALIAGCASTSPSTSSEDSYNQGMSQAEAALTSGQKEQALSLFEQVARNNPAREEPWSRIAQIQYADQKYPQAIVAAEEALQRDATDRKAKSILAVSGLRVARRSVMELRDDSALAGDVKTDAQVLAKMMRETLGEQVLFPDEKPKAQPVVKRRPVARPTHAQANQAANAAAGAATNAVTGAVPPAAANAPVTAPAPAATAAPAARGGDPFGALR
ncbi:tetratricopeptide repeat protein [Cupriavidus pauculus]|uniref:tetratricopeptide repeat protein n=1 Tax=Cupriavidus pauculus TaxID=82633 RepID=UPI0038579179